MPSSKTSQPTLERTILELLEQRAPGKTICPSEAARKAYPDRWREEMENTRTAAATLAERNEIEICQKGEAINPVNFRGPIRLRKKS